ncbi:hypothetical protein [Facklamia sp. P12934]|uniref:DUF7916 family protein n=1 Tax=unclassified Facklamia TaxID=2622293 RepID=UPI003D168E36
MKKKLISANASDIKTMTAQEIKQSIKASEDRVVLTEAIAQKDTYIADVTGAEVAFNFGLKNM